MCTFIEVLLFKSYLMLYSQEFHEQVTIIVLFPPAKSFNTAKIVNHIWQPMYIYLNTDWDVLPQQ